MTARGFVFTTIIAAIVGTASVGSAESDKCDLRRFYDCTGAACESSSGGPAGETPCCKPPPYRPQLCGAAKIWLPTTVYYPAPESVYNESMDDGGFAATQSIAGGYVKIGLNPGWVLFYGYGVMSCAPWVVLVGEPMSNPVSSAKSDRGWSFGVGKGHVQPLKDYGNRVPAITRSKVDDRLFASSYTLFYRAAKEQSAAFLASKFSFSPYANKCYRPSSALHSSLEAYKTRSDRYGMFGSFLNRFNDETYSTLNKKLGGGKLPFLGPMPFAPGDGTKMFDSSSCTETAQLYERRPVYFVYSYYLISVIKGTMKACQG